MSNNVGKISRTNRIDTNGCFYEDGSIVTHTHMCPSCGYAYDCENIEDICTFCKNAILNGQVYDAENKPYCRSCYEDQFKECYECEVAFRPDKMVHVDGEGDEYWCQSCAEDWIFPCEACDKLNYEINVYRAEKDGKELWCCFNCIHYKGYSML